MTDAGGGHHGRIRFNVEAPARIETERLVLRPFAPRDAEALHALWTDPAVRRYLFDDEIIPRSVVDEEIAVSERLMAVHGYGLWTVRLRDADAIIGFCGYRFFHEPPQLQLLYGLAPAYWDRGLATEAARAMIRRGFDVNGFDRIIASADAPNAASHRVMERAGMRFWKRETVNGLDTVYYELTHRAEGSGKEAYPQMTQMTQIGKKREMTRKGDD
jgi:ribosomal-protein-alanine N-acetyltransferase